MFDFNIKETTASHRGLPQTTNTIMVFPRRLFATTYSGYHPDDLLNQIPEPAPALTNFVLPPFRSIPPNLISAVTIPHPNLHDEPDWSSFLAHFYSRTAIHGLVNLQDLYLYLTHVAITNAVIDNRRFLLHFYARNSTASPNIDLRYNA